MLTAFIQFDTFNQQERYASTTNTEEYNMKINDLATESTHDDWNDEAEEVIDPDMDTIPHIVMQLKKALDVSGRHPIVFQDGNKTLLPAHLIRQFMSKYSSLKPYQREELQDIVSKSKEAFMKVVGQN